MKFYRIVFKDGRHCAWSSDYESVKKSAEFFGAEIGEKVVDITIKL